MSDRLLSDPATSDEPPQPRTSSPKSELERAAWPALTPETVDFRQHGESRALRAGNLLFDVGQDRYDFVYIEAGAVAIVDRADDRVVVRVEASHFIGV